MLNWKKGKSKKLLLQFFKAQHDSDDEKRYANKILDSYFLNACIYVLQMPDLNITVVYYIVLYYDYRIKYSGECPSILLFLENVVCSIKSTKKLPTTV